MASLSQFKILTLALFLGTAWGAKLFFPKRFAMPNDITVAVEHVVIFECPGGRVGVLLAPVGTILALWPPSGPQRGPEPKKAPFLWWKRRPFGVHFGFPLACFFLICFCFDSYFCNRSSMFMFWSIVGVKKGWTIMFFGGVRHGFRIAICV